MGQPVTAKPQPVRITVEIDKEGNFIYRPALLRASREDSISWRCDQGDFTVSFPGRTPFEKVNIHGFQGEDTNPEPFQDHVELGVYHYHVAVAVQTQNAKGLKATRIHVDSGCPGIEVAR